MHAEHGQVRGLLLLPACCMLGTHQLEGQQAAEAGVASRLVGEDHPGGQGAACATCTGEAPRPNLCTGRQPSTGVACRCRSMPASAVPQHAGTPGGHPHQRREGPNRPLPPRLAARGSQERLASTPRRLCARCSHVQVVHVLAAVRLLWQRAGLLARACWQAAGERLPCAWLGGAGSAPADVSASTRRLKLPGYSAAMVSAMKPPRLQPLHTAPPRSASSCSAASPGHGCQQPVQPGHRLSSSHSTIPRRWLGAHKRSGTIVCPGRATKSSWRKSTVDSAGSAGT